MIKNLNKMPSFGEVLTQGVSQGFNKFQNEKNNEFFQRNPQASNFLKAFLGSGALQFQDESGSISINPRTGAFSGTPKNPEGIGFSINPLTQSVSLKKGNFELSGGLADAPSMSTGYSPSGQSFVNSVGGNQKQTPWGQIGFQFGQPSFKTGEYESTARAIQSVGDALNEQKPQTNLNQVETGRTGLRQFANPEVERLLNKATSPWSSGPDKYNPSTW